MKDAKIRRCASCVLSGAFPGIAFDEHGVCNFCRNERQVTSGGAAIDGARTRIQGLIEAKRGTSRYDAVVCYSGGKDSAYALMLAVRKYGLNVLSFTLDNGFLSHGALENINRVVDALGVDQVTLRPSADFFGAVITTSVFHDIYAHRVLERISSGCQACISLVNITALKFALEKEIPFILAGFTLGQIPVNGVVYKSNYRFLQKSREAVLNKLRTHVGDCVNDYYGIRESLIDRVSSYPYNINLLCLENITEGEIVKAIETLGWKRPGDVDGNSSNCRLNTFNNYVHQKKFGYSPYELELSHLIRKGLMTRGEALAKLADESAGQLPSVMARLGITAADIDALGTGRHGPGIGAGQRAG